MSRFRSLYFSFAARGRSCCGPEWGRARAIDEPVCNQIVHDAADPYAAHERPCGMAGERIAEGCQGGIATPVDGESAEGELGPLPREVAAPPLAERDDSIQPPVPGDGRPEGQPSRPPVLDPDSLQGEITGDVDEKATGAHETEAEQPRRTPHPGLAEPGEMAQAAEWLTAAHPAGVQRSAVRLDGELCGSQRPAHPEIDLDVVPDGSPVVLQPIASQLL